MPEAHVLLASSNPTSLPSDDKFEELANLPSSVALARFSVKRWREFAKNSADFSTIDALFTKFFTDAKLLSLQPKALAFFQVLRGLLESLNLASLEKFGCVTGEVYDEVFGQEESNGGRSVAPDYLPSVSHFQNNFHNLFVSNELRSSWSACIRTISPELSPLTANRAFVFLLSYLEDIAFARLVATILGGSNGVANFL